MMTHDELLAKIDYYLVPTYKLSGDEGIKNSAIGFMQALRAVVELHKPYGSESKGFICEFCMEKALPTWVYPCPTIQAIEKELQ